MALAAGHECLPGRQVTVENMLIQQVLSLPTTGTQVVQVICEPETDSTDSSYRFQVFSLAAEQPADNQARWDLHATGKLVADSAEPARAGTGHPTTARAARSVNRRAGLLSGLSIAGDLDYGPSFRGIQRLCFAGDQALGEVRLLDTLCGQLGQYALHPCLLDACFQAIGAPIGSSGESHATLLPVGFRRLRLFQRASRTS